MRELHLTVDQQSLGEEWPYVEIYCRILRAELTKALRADFSDVELSVEPERQSFNGGGLRFLGEWDNLGDEDLLRQLVTHWQTEVYWNTKWVPTHNGSIS